MKSENISMFVTSRVRTAHAIVATIVFAATAISVAIVSDSLVGVADEAARSDRFWQMLDIRSVDAESFASLEQMAQAADVVAVARIWSVDVSRTIGKSYPLTLAAVRLEVLSGIAGTADGKTIVLEMILPREDLLPLLRESLPAESSLYFLRDKFSLVKDEDLPAATKNLERGLYALVNDGQGVIRNIGGVARTSPMADQDDSFLAEINGESFDDIVARAAGARSQ